MSINSKDTNPRPMRFGAVLKLSFILGMGCGVVLIPVMAITYLPELGLLFGVAILLFTPLLNGLVTASYALLGYWLYLFFVKKGWMKL